MLNVVCANCGTTFGAQRKTAQYCSGKCKVAAVRKRARTGESPIVASTSAVQAVQARRDGPPLVVLPPRHESEEGMIAVTRRTLEEADRLDTYHGVVAMAQARILDSGVQDSMSSMAAMFKEYKASMASALEGANKVEDAVDNLMRRRAARSA